VGIRRLKRWLAVVATGAAVLAIHDRIIRGATQTDVSPTPLKGVVKPETDRAMQ